MLLIFPNIYSILVVFKFHTFNKAYYKICYQQTLVNDNALSNHKSWDAKKTQEKTKTKCWGSHPKNHPPNLDPQQLKLKLSGSVKQDAELTDLPGDSFLLSA